jgi:hypothetical protein
LGSTDVCDDGVLGFGGAMSGSVPLR